MGAMAIACPFTFYDIDAFSRVQRFFHMRRTILEDQGQKEGFPVPFLGDIRADFFPAASCHVIPTNLPVSCLQRESLRTKLEAVPPSGSAGSAELGELQRVAMLRNRHFGIV
ncbi:hypothetical protein JCM17478_22660 [Thermopirellula anaerolimosa]